MLFTSAAAPTPDEAYRAARALFDRSDFKSVIAEADAALARFGGRDDDALWRLRAMRALALVETGNWPVVLAAATPDLPPRLRQSDAAVERLLALAIAQYNLSNFGETKGALAAAERLAAPYPSLLAKARIYRANMYRIFPPDVRIRAARDNLRDAKRSGDLTQTARANGLLGFVLGTSGRFDEAVGFVEEANRISTKLGNESLIEKNELNLGWYYNALGDPESATEHLQRAIALCVRLGADAHRLVALQQLGNTEVLHGDVDSARRHYMEALDLAKKTKSPHLGTSYLVLAELAQRTGDVAAARQYNVQALAENQKANENDDVFRSRILDARMNRDSAALEDVIAAAKSKSILWEAHAELAQIYAAQQKNDLAEKHFDDAVDITDAAREDVGNGDRKLAFSDLARELNESYVDFLISIDRQRDALRVAEAYRAQSLAEDRESAFEPERVAKDAGVAVLSYWLAPKRSFVWVVKSSGVEAFVLPPKKEIESAIETYQTALLGPRDANRADGIRLYRLLVEPAASALRGESRIAVIPDGRVSLFNLETIIVPDPKPHYWIEDVTVQRAPSLLLLARSREETKRGRLLLIGDAPQADPAFPSLRNAHAEIERVRGQFTNVTTLDRARATPRAYFASAPESYAFLHFVAHGVAARLQPLDSAIILGPDRDGYKLYARDIAQHPLHARLVTISSCHGAGRRAFAGEGLVGLAWAFLRAGAQQVIASLWEVDDNASPEFMDSMYKAIVAGRAPADALREAKLKMLRSNTIHRKPRYWAPFVLYSRS